MPKKSSTPRTPRFYPADDLPPRKVSKANKMTKLRASLTPGTVVILLAGRFRGKRVVFLKQLPSGLLLVSGPFKVNGVPVKRVSQSYVIATSLKVNVDPSVAKDIDDAYFQKEVSAGGDESNEDKFFEEKKAQKVVSEKRKTDQAAVDGALMKAIGSVEMMKEYLAAPFTLSKKDKPHNMVF